MPKIEKTFLKILDSTLFIRGEWDIILENIIYGNNDGKSENTLKFKDFIMLSVTYSAFVKNANPIKIGKIIAIVFLIIVIIDFTST